MPLNGLYHNVYRVVHVVELYLQTFDLDDLIIKNSYDVGKQDEVTYQLWQGIS